jgi:hypothetical protein
VSETQPTPHQRFAASLTETVAHLNDTVDAAMDGASGASPVEAANIAHRVLAELRSEKAAFDNDFFASIDRLERVAAGSHEPVPHEE